MTEKSSLPLISIIVPTFNRMPELRRCLASIARLDADASSFEVIIVNDGGRESCDQLAAKILSGCNHVSLRQDNLGPAAARNLGARRARGRYLAFLDDDCTLPGDWFRNVSARLDERAMIGGLTENMLRNELFPAASQDLIEYLYRYYNRDSRQARFLTSNNMIVPRRMFLELGGFSSAYRTAAAEDRDFCDRWLSAGFPIRHFSEIVVEHHHKMNFRQFAGQHFRYGCGAFVFHRERKLRGSRTVDMENWRFYMDLLLFPFRKKGWNRAFYLSLSLFMSQVCNAAGFYWTKTRNSSLVRKAMPESVKPESIMQPED